MTSNLISSKSGQTRYFRNVTQTSSKEENKLLKFVESLLMPLKSSKNKTRIVKLLNRAISESDPVSGWGFQNFAKQDTKEWVNFQKLWGLFEMFQRSTKNKIRGKKSQKRIDPNGLAQNWPKQGVSKILLKQLRKGDWNSKLLSRVLSCH